MINKTPYSIYFWLVFFLCYSTLSVGQKKIPKSKISKRSSPASDLKYAKSLVDTKPLEAIDLIDKILLQINENKKYVGLSSECYFLLGEIYEGIDQSELALSRYQMSVQYVSESYNKSFLEPQLHERIGTILLESEKLDGAERNYKLCIDLSDKQKDLLLDCREGLIDVNIARNRLNKAQELIDQLRSNEGPSGLISGSLESTSLDSLTLARLDARQSQIYFLNNDPQNASQFLFNSVNTLPRNQELTYRDLKPVKIAQDQLLFDTNFSIEEKKEVISNVNYNIRNKDDIYLSQNFKTSTFLEKENDKDAAREIVEKSKALITGTTNAEVAAKIYKRSADYNLERQRYSTALEDLENYSRAKEKAVEDKEQELKNQIDIVKRQQNLDIVSKEYDIQIKDQRLTANRILTQQLIIGFLGILLLSAMVFFYSLTKSIRAQKRANKMLNLKSLRTQMNPHFIFNALNSVNNFIAKNDDISANQYLGDFSHLMRQVLDHSQKDFITIEEEAQLNERYLKLEHSRFRDQFEYNFENKTSNEGLEVVIPPMLIQPFIENAVWHGLRYKDQKGELSVVMKDDQSKIEVTITDNGIGRKRSQQLKTTNQKKYKSKGLSNIDKRVELLNDLYDKKYKIQVSDAYPESIDVGTKVIIQIPKSR